MLRRMKILIIGASQGTGAEAAKNALERGHAVTAFARTPQKLALEHEHLTLVQGDFHQAESVAKAVPGHDAVIITASATSLKAFKENPNYFSQGTRFTIDAMKAHGVRRLIVLSALGTGESRKLMGWFLDMVMISWLLKVPYQDHERQERLVTDSGLDWVIARPGRLTNGPANKSYVTEVEVKPIPKSISRADVADFLVRAATEDRWLQRAVQLGG
jgi:putative NADH-flavin reductase